MRITRLGRIALSITLIALAAACGDATSPASNDLAANRQRWAAANVNDYQYIYRALCFCATIDSVRVLVSADSVRSAIRLPKGEQLDPSEFPTVEALFKIVDDANAAKREVHVAYHWQFGFPTKIDLPGRPGWADDGATYFISGFQIATLTTSSALDRR
jgi:hypothetical protein